MQKPVEVFLILLLSCFCCSLAAQDRATLEKRRQNLEKQIEETNTLLRRSEKQKSATVSSLQTLRSEIAMRQEVLTSLKDEMGLLDDELDHHAVSLDKLQKTMEALREERGKQMRNAYFEKQMSHPLLYILSARTLNEAFLRWTYRRRIMQAREQTLDQLRATSHSLQDELGSLEALKSQKQEISKDVASQESSLKKSAGEAQAMVKSLEKKERSLKKQLEQQKKESQALAAEIERIIAAEVKKNSAAGNLPSAPALKALSADFERNKGKLPWPVDHGIITSHFGTQPHPIVKSITVSNNGIDITAPKASDVHSIFGGKVVGKKFIPGFDNMVIIQHGNYYSVYSRLADVGVEINQEVTARQTIGRLSGKGNENPRLHLEIWENKVQLDPQLWISR